MTLLIALIHSCMPLLLDFYMHRPLSACNPVAFFPLVFLGGGVGEGMSCMQLYH